MFAGTVLLHAISAGQAADAANGNINFGINIYEPNLCTIIVRNDGTMTPDVTNQVLSSKEAGGVSGVADVYSWRPYDLQVDAVPFFLAMPPDGDSGVTISSTFSGTALNARGLTFPERPGSSPVRLRRGYSATRITVDMTATRVGSRYPAGDYAALSIVRCE
ncbi:MAG: hypothetical protein R3D45_06910 [Rhizobiaceae bacterium]